MTKHFVVWKQQDQTLHYFGEKEGSKALAFAKEVNGKILTGSSAIDNPTIQENLYRLASGNPDKTLPAEAASVDKVWAKVVNAARKGTTSPAVPSSASITDSKPKGKGKKRTGVTPKDTRKAVPPAELTDTAPAATAPETPAPKAPTKAAIAKAAKAVKAAEKEAEKEAAAKTAKAEKAVSTPEDAPAVEATPTVTTPPTADKPTVDKVAAKPTTSDPASDPVSHGFPVLNRVSLLDVVPVSKDLEGSEYRKSVSAAGRAAYQRIDPATAMQIRLQLAKNRAAYGKLPSFEKGAEMLGVKGVLSGKAKTMWGTLIPDVKNAVGRQVTMQLTARRGSGNWITYQLLLGVDVELLIDACATIYPASNQGAKDIQWYQWDLRRHGFTDEKNALTKKGKKIAAQISERLGWAQATTEMVGT